MLYHSTRKCFLGNFPNFLFKISNLTPLLIRMLVLLSIKSCENKHVIGSKVQLIFSRQLKSESNSCIDLQSCKVPYQYLFVVSHHLKFTEHGNVIGQTHCPHYLPPPHLPPFLLLPQFLGIMQRYSPSKVFLINFQMYLVI